ncbi:MAG: hypothetical protein M0Q38_11700 [Bacteroidales bacterium]|jgi:electron transfer flavoprotein alpha subunit|nr:hypothetical protein [Bacteroidales bacterium]
MSVLIFLENWDGKFKKLSFELASYGFKLAEMLNTEPVAITLGNVASDELKKIGKYGINRMIHIQGNEINSFDSQLFNSIIAHVAEKEKSTVIILSNNNTGKAIAPRLSVRLKAGLGAGVNNLPRN